MTNDPMKAHKIMAWTDLNADYIQKKYAEENNIERKSNGGRKRTLGGVYHMSFSWAKDENPDIEEQKQYALKALENLQLENNQYVMACHNDTDHNHIHVVANLTNHETGKRAQVWKSQRRLQKQALEYEKENGIYCEDRFKTAAELQKAKLAHKITRAYEVSDNSQSFKNAVELEGYTLAAGRKGRVVFVDDNGKIQNLSRYLKGFDEPTEALKSKLEGIDLASLPEADKKAAEIKAAKQPWDREAAEVEKQKKLAAGAEEAAKKKTEAETAKIRQGKAEEAARRKARDKFFAEKRKNAEAWKKRREDTRRVEISNIIDGINRKTKEARQGLKINELTQAREKAILEAANTANEAAANNTFIGFISGKRRKASAAADDAARKLEAAEKTLAERLNRFESHIRKINKVRQEWIIDKEPKGAIDPDWTIKKELEKQGLYNQEFRRKWAREQRLKKEAEIKAIKPILEAAINGDHTDTPEVGTGGRAVGKEKLKSDFTGKTQSPAIKPKSVMDQIKEFKKAREQEQSQSPATPSQQPPEAARPKSAMEQVADYKRERAIKREGVSLEKKTEKTKEIDNGLDL
jgi:hypothetical protein